MNTTRSNEATGGAAITLDDRSREIFRQIVDAYVETGEPIGSRTLSRRLSTTLSPATIRNVMADLEQAGLLASPHTSAGRIPTDAGLRLFVDGLLEVGSLTSAEQAHFTAVAGTKGRSLPQLLEDATAALSGLSRCAGLVVAPKTEARLRHIEFVSLGPGRALVVLVTEDGQVENRLLDVPLGLPPANLVIAGNYLNAKLVGRTIGETRSLITEEISQHRAELDGLTERVVESGLAMWAGDDGGSARALIVRGQSHLLHNITDASDIERIRMLFQALETRESMLQLLDAANLADGVQIFIGAHNALFNLAGCSVVIAPYSNGRRQIVGAIGVIGPARINYARIIPMVDYTAKVIGQMLG